MIYVGYEQLDTYTAFIDGAAIMQMKALKLAKSSGEYQYDRNWRQIVIYA